MAPALLYLENFEVSWARTNLPSGDGYLKVTGELKKNIWAMTLTDGFSCLQGGNHVQTKSLASRRAHFRKVAELFVVPASLVLFTFPVLFPQGWREVYLGLCSASLCVGI